MSWDSLMTVGVCDAIVLSLFEGKREKDKQSQPWTARQTRKVNGGLRALSQWVENRKGEYLVGNALSVADLAVCSLLGYMLVRFPDHDWQEKYPALKDFRAGLDERESFATTRPTLHTYKDQVV
jgi:glutathione S-transferase